MIFQLTERQKLIRLTDGVLNIPGNFTKDLLEMAIVLDHGMEKVEIGPLAAELVNILKRHSQIFRNVRLNIVDWKSDSEITTQVSAMPMLQLGRYFDSYVQTEETKSLDLLAGYLKMYHARSKLIYVLSAAQSIVKSRERMFLNINPFLKRKLIFIEKGVQGYESFLCMLYLQRNGTL